jgi:hypothetical protein
VDEDGFFVQKGLLEDFTYTNKETGKKELVKDTKILNYSRCSLNLPMKGGHYSKKVKNFEEYIEYLNELRREKREELTKVGDIEGSNSIKEVKREDWKIDIENPSESSLGEG